MSRYKDRNGTRINRGDCVLTAITINHEVFAPMTYDLSIVKLRDGRLVLDSWATTAVLATMPRSQMWKVTSETDLSEVHSTFAREFPSAAP